MGFRDLQQFNQALLANQYWKIAHRPKSLIFRVLENRYFKNKSIWEATKGHQTSYGWNSLLYGKELLTKGYQCGIGNGSETLLRDNWLPTTPPRSPSLLPYTNPTLRVDCLINKETHQWNQEVLDDLIDQSDHHLIKKIFLGFYDSADYKIWPYTSHGNYTARSGYHFSVANNDSLEERRPPLFTKPAVSKAIWTADIVPKLRHFLWSISSKAISITENLQRRNIPVDPYCVRCCDIVETANHLFFQCPYAQQVWRQSGLMIPTLHDSHISIDDKLLMLLHLSKDSAIPRNVRLRPIWILWRLWKSRNELIFNSKVIPHEVCFTLAVSDVHEWVSCTAHLETGVSPARQQTQPMQYRSSKWKKPPMGWVKCNYDSSHRNDNTPSGMGWIIRSCNGTFLHCGHGLFEGRTTVVESEATSLIWAMQACLSLGYRNIIFEGDNLQLKNVLQDNESNIKLQNLKSSIMGLQQGFARSRFDHCKREANGCADKLAKFSITCNHVWGVYHICPPFLQLSVILDNE
ncbi:hypothetical protein Bca52824_010659 [Brassica carinata]|uniref:RNase H type-1 domain-containing protein n=1 Tax=Brassica carinata TaxID=52824 RepID=A0A8X7WD42_BRACI|nr:hypothetical protein Bca52824_010659 [Brassica carinata]